MTKEFVPDLVDFEFRRTFCCQCQNPLYSMFLGRAWCVKAQTREQTYRAAMDGKGPSNDDCGLKVRVSTRCI